MAEISHWKFLVVEDEPDGQTILAGLLRHAHIDTCVVGSAEEALKNLATFIYTGVVIDLGLPGMDGMGLIKVIRSSSTLAHLPCMAVTAFHSSKVKKLALEAGFNEYVSKPIDRTMLIEALNRIII